MHTTTYKFLVLFIYLLSLIFRLRKPAILPLFLLTVSNLDLRISLNIEDKHISNGKLYKL